MSSISRINRAVKRFLFSNFLLLQGLLGLTVLLLKIKFHVCFIIIEISVKYLSPLAIEKFKKFKLRMVNV